MTQFPYSRSVSMLVDAHGDQIPAPVILSTLLAWFRDEAVRTGSWSVHLEHLLDVVQMGEQVANAAPGTLPMIHRTDGRRNGGGWQEIVVRGIPRINPGTPVPSATAPLEQVLSTITARYPVSVPQMMRAVALCLDQVIDAERYNRNPMPTLHWWAEDSVQVPSTFLRLLEANSTRYFTTSVLDEDTLFLLWATASPPAAGATLRQVSSAVVDQFHTDPERGWHPAVPIRYGRTLAGEAVFLLTRHGEEYLAYLPDIAPDADQYAARITEWAITGTSDPRWIIVSPWNWRASPLLTV